MSTLDQQRGKGYFKGVEDLRGILCREFAAQGQSSFSGLEIAQLIKQAPGPARESENEEAERKPVKPADEQKAAEDLGLSGGICS